MYYCKDCKKPFREEDVILILEGDPVFFNEACPTCFNTNLITIRRWRRLGKWESVNA